MRTETDFIGNIELPDEALYGIHAFRAGMNFPDTTRFHSEWYCATGSVKKACYLTYQKYASAVGKKYPVEKLPLQVIDNTTLSALINASSEVEKGNHFDHFIVPAVQGGAGTSINMNINEIITNRALQLSGRQAGEYRYIHPIEHANVFQSTNDVIPTALKVCLLRLIHDLTNSINLHRMAMEVLEKKAATYSRISYTEMQEAVPSTYGRLFSTYCEALSRDWWRTSKASERIKTVNLGGSAIGSGITVPVLFIREVVPMLQQITQLPISRAENLNDATCNLDALVEMHGIFKAHAINLEKIAADFRLLSSELFIHRAVEIPNLQTGSSIMPGKVNPVVPEFVISAAHKVYSNDLLVSNLCGQGCLDLNPYIPVIGHALIDSLKLLNACNITLNKNMMGGIRLMETGSMDIILHSPSVTTALIPYIGYVKASEMAKEMKKRNAGIIEVNNTLAYIEKEKLNQLLAPENLFKEGFSVQDIMGENGERKGK